MKMPDSKKITQGLRPDLHSTAVPTMSSSTTSLYNAARKKFLKGRGEKISGNPGEKLKCDSLADEKEEGGNGGQGRDGSSGDGDGGQEKAARIGPRKYGATLSHVMVTV